MNTEAVNDPIAPVAPAPEAPPEPSLEDTTLSDHEAAFGPVDPTLDGDAKVKADEKREKIRHRAKSQQAGPEDVPRIQALTKEKRQLEEKLAALEARVNQPAPVAPRQAPAVAQREPAAAGDAIPPTRPKPTEDMIGATYATYADMVEDLSNWTFEQRQAKWERDQQQTQFQAEQTRAQQEWNQAHQTFGTRVGEFMKTHPDYQAKLDSVLPLNIPPAAYQAILKHDNGPAFVYHLVNHPDQLAEMVFLMDGKPPSDDHVALATRWLSSRTQAASTGSAVPTPPQTLAAHPPNPVRTGPTKTSGDLPGDDASLADHEKAYGRARRR